MADENKLLTKMKKDPMVPVGITGLIGIVAYAVYNFRNKKSKSIALYVIHTRLAAQGAVIGSITLGMFYSIYSQISKKYSKTESNNSSS